MAQTFPTVSAVTHRQRVPQTPFGHPINDDDIDTWEDKEIGKKAEYRRVVERYEPTTMKWSLLEQEEDIVEDSGNKKKIDPQDEFCFLFRKKLTPTSADKPPSVQTFLDIKSWYLRKAGRDVIGDNAGISWRARPLEVSIPCSIPYPLMRYRY